MSLRVTRLLVEALGSSDVNLRVTRQIVEVLQQTNQTFEESVTSNLSLTQVANIIRNQEPSNTLSLSQQAEVGGSIVELLSSSLNLGQTASFKRDVPLGASSPLLLDQDAKDLSIKVSAANNLNLSQSTEQNQVVASASNILSLTDTVKVAETILESASNSLNLAQSVDQNLKFESVVSTLNLSQLLSFKLNDDFNIPASNTLNLSDSASVGNFIFERDLPDGSPGDPGGGDAVLQLVQSVFLSGDRQLFPIDTLALVQAVSVRQAVVNVDLTSFLSLSQELGRVLPEAASSDLQLLQEMFRIFKPENTLTLTQSAVGAALKIIESSLTFSQAVTKLQEYARTISSPLTLAQSAFYLLNDPDVCNYNPSVGVVSSGITPPPTTAPTLSKATLQLRFPADTPTLTTTLNNPEFGNTDTLSFNRVKRQSRGGTLLVFADPTWPKHQRLRMQIENLKIDSRNQLQIFLESSLGQEILLDDWENRTWRGIIVNPDAEFTQTGKNRYSITLEFEGNLV